MYPKIKSINSKIGLKHQFQFIIKRIHNLLNKMKLIRFLVSMKLDHKIKIQGKSKSKIEHKITREKYNLTKGTPSIKN